MIGPWGLARSIRSTLASRSFAQACAQIEARPLWLGLEHEFLVFGGGGHRLDFRTVIHGLGLGRPDLVPGDRNAYRLPTGSVVTADTTEAEIATPPIEVRPGFAARLDGWAAFERAALAGRVAPLTLGGESTHLNVALPRDVDADRVADLFATRFAPGLMLLMDRWTSPGLLVRPRPFRLELGGEYVTGSALRAATAYSVGATLACVAWLRHRRKVELPAALAMRLERGVLRYGWYVDRRAFGVDLYAHGRSTWLATVDDERMCAQNHLERAWSVARRHVEPHADRVDLRDADDLVGGRGLLPVERLESEPETTVARPRRPRSAFGTAVRVHRRPGYELAPVMLTWQAAVFLAVRRDRRQAAFIALPGAALGGFFERLRAGDLDAAVEAYLALRPAGRRLSDPRQLMGIGLHDELGLRAGLLAPERDYWGRLVRHRLPGHSVPAGAGSASA